MKFSLISAGARVLRRLSRRSQLDIFAGVTREWKVPLPMASRKPDYPKCAKCFASFMLDSDAEWHRATAAGRGTFSCREGRLEDRVLISGESGQHTLEGKRV